MKIFDFVKEYFFFTLFNMNKPLNKLMGPINLYKDYAYPSLKGKLLMGNRPTLGL